MLEIRSSDTVMLSGQSTSKGNQIKLKYGDNFYKLDTMGYESIAEALVSELEEYIQDFPHINYYLEEVMYRGEVHRTCVSKDFSNNAFIEVTLYRILQVADVDYEIKVGKYVGLDLVRYIEEVIEGYTGVNIHKYLGGIVFLDSIILNEDRHLNNIAMKKYKSYWEPMEVYDNGLSLLSDIGMYDLDISLNVCLRKVKARPFSTSFKKQVKYFSDVSPLVISYDDLVSKLDLVKSEIDEYIPFGKRYYNRADIVLRTQLEKMEGISWVRK